MLFKVLNEFGNSIIKKLGKTRLLQLRLHPEELPAALGHESDIDSDGIADAAEYLAGTDPTDESSGAPAQLFVTNLRRYAFNLIMMAVATGLGVYGLNALLHWFDMVMRGRKDTRSQNT